MFSLKRARQWFQRKPRTIVNKFAKRRAKPILETLEDRLAPATITVNSLADGATPLGQVTLRQAIQAAETQTSVNGSVAGTGNDTIVFAPALFTSGPATITLSNSNYIDGSWRALSITSQITIQGTRYPEQLEQMTGR